MLLAILKAVSIFTWLMYLWLKITFGFHMLQQESYLNKEYFKWVNKNKSKVMDIYDFIPQLAVFLVLIFTENIFAYMVWTFGNLLTFYKKYKHTPKAKKPLVYTARVKRLVAVGAIFCVIIGVLLFLLAENRIYIVLLTVIIINIFGFLLVATINIINRPMELLVNKWYYNDAKKIIRRMTGLKIIGITGSYGKTSSKFILARILSEKYNTVATPESYNTTMGVVKTIRGSLKPIHEVFVCEMGAKYVNDIKEICKLVNPQYGIITSIGPQHLETFKNMDNIIKTKYELTDALKDKSNGIINISSQYIKENPVENATTYGCEKDDGGDYYAAEINYGPSGASFLMCGKDITPFRLETKLLGKHNILNIIGAAAMAHKLGLTSGEIAYAVKRLEPIAHRLELKKREGGITVIDDAFNSNVEGAKSAVSVLGSFKQGGRMLITPGMVELGEKEYEYNYEFGKQAADNCDFVILVGEKQAPPIKKGLEDKKFNKDKLYVAKDLNDALIKMNEVASGGWTVLFENDLPDLYL